MRRLAPILGRIRRLARRDVGLTIAVLTLLAIVGLVFLLDARDAGDGPPIAADVAQEPEPPAPEPSDVAKEPSEEPAAPDADLPDAPADTEQAQSALTRDAPPDAAADADDAASADDTLPAAAADDAPAAASSDDDTPAADSPLADDARAPDTPAADEAPADGEASSGDAPTGDEAGAASPSADDDEVVSAAPEQDVEAATEAPPATTAEDDDEEPAPAVAAVDTSPAADIAPRPRFAAPEPAADAAPPRFAEPPPDPAPAPQPVAQPPPDPASAPQPVVASLADLAPPPRPVAEPPADLAPPPRPVAEPPPESEQAPPDLPVTQPLGILAPAIVERLEALPNGIGITTIDLRRDLIFTHHADTYYDLASVAKVPLMLAVLQQGEQDERTLSRRDQALLKMMIHTSNNEAASILWQGAGNTVPGLLSQIDVWPGILVPGGWGIWTGNAYGVAQVFREIVAGESLSEDVRHGAMSLLAGVAPSQRWGISAGLPEGGASVGLKNGWYPAKDGWLVHSAGYVLDAGGRPDYVIVILSAKNTTLADGIDLVEEIAASLHAALRTGVVSAGIPRPDR